MPDLRAPRTIAETLKQAEQILAAARVSSHHGAATVKAGGTNAEAGGTNAEAGDTIAQAGNTTADGGHRDDGHTFIARQEAETLICWVCGWNRTQLVLRLGETPDAAALLHLEEAIRQRVQGVPLQYIVGEAPFLGRTFAVRPGCLIPRPETEVLADAVIRWVEAHCRTARVVDVGTGSGILGISVAIACPQARVTALDVSDAALAIARENGERLEAQVDFVHCDGLQWLDEHEGQVQVLISNPPYIESEAIESLDREVRLFEPHLALDGGPDGLVFYRALAARPKVYTLDGPASIFLEVGFGQSDSVVELFRQNGEWGGWTFDVIPDLRGIGRVVWGQRLT